MLVYDWFFPVSASFYRHGFVAHYEANQARVGRPKVITINFEGTISSTGAVKIHR